MNKNDHVVHSGWMTKSPPEKKLLGPWKLFRANSNSNKWKRRYFVLSKPAGSLPEHYVLSYFSDDLCRRRKGHIDLEQCEQIIESLASEQYDYLFSIKTNHKSRNRTFFLGTYNDQDMIIVTYHKSRDRTYFLGTDNEQDMIMWVRSLCQVCGLKQEDSPVELPPPGQGTPAPEPPEIRRIDKQKSTRSAPPVPPDSPEPPVWTPRPIIHGSDDENETESPYLYVSDCHTGTKFSADRQISRCSVPEEIAPSPPTRDKTENDANSSDSANPRDSNVSMDSLYKVPPRAYRLSDRLSDEYNQYYDVPPPRKVGSTSPHSSSEDSHTGDSAYMSDVYKYPPAPRQFTPPQSRSSDEMKHSFTDYYDSLPPPRVIEAPPRPPRSVSTSIPETVNLNDSVPTQRISDIVDDDEYQIPPSNASTDLMLSPPPPSCQQNLHNYQNAAPGFTDKPPPQDGYLAMNQTNSDHHLSDLPNGDAGPYTDMTGMMGTVPVDEMTSSRDSDVYQYPPPCPRPVRTTDAPIIPPRTKTSLTESGTMSLSISDDDAYSIFSSERTRSFKKIGGNDDTPEHSPHLTSPPKPATRKPPPAAPSPVVRPQPRVQPPTPKATTEEEQIMYDIEKSIFIKRTPPAPKKSEGDLKYLDLDLDNQFVNDSKSLPQINSSTTEYREIDFIKTQALSKTKQSVEDKRKT